MTEKTMEFFDILKQERRDSAKERKELQRQFLDGIKSHTEQQNLAMQTLGDRMERQMISMRNDLRSATNRLTTTLIVSLLVVASLAGVAVRYQSDSIGSIALSPQADMAEPPLKGQSDHK